MSRPVKTIYAPTTTRPVTAPPAPKPATKPLDLFAPTPQPVDLFAGGAPNLFAASKSRDLFANPQADLFAAAKTEAPDLFAAGGELDPGGKGRGRVKPVRKILVRRHMIMPPFGPKPRKREGWSLAIKWLVDQDREACISPKYFAPGDPWDFTDEANWLAGVEHYYAREEGADDYCGDEVYDDDGDVRSDHLHHLQIQRFHSGAGPWWGWEDNLQMECSDASEPAWVEFIAMWAAARAEILDDPGAVLGSSTGDMCAFEILQCAGYEFAAGLYGSGGLISKIYQALEEGDTSVWAALPDIVLQAEAGTIGYFPDRQMSTSVSKELYHLGEQLADKHSIYPLPARWSQFLVFDQLHDHVAPTTFPSVEGKYVVFESSYHSVCEEPDAGAPAGLVGWGESYLIPTDADYQPLRTPGGSVQGTLF